MLSNVSRKSMVKEAQRVERAENSARNLLRVYLPVKGVGENNTVATGFSHVRECSAIDDDTW